MASPFSSAKEYVRTNRTFFLFALLLLVSVSGYFWWRSGFSFQFSRFFASCETGDCDDDGYDNPFVRGDDCDDGNPDIGGSASCRWCQADQVQGGQTCGDGDCDDDGHDNPSVGGDDCDDGNWCNNGGGCGPAPTHMACRNNSCTQVSGGGGDECSSDGDCAPTQNTCEANGHVCIANYPGGGCPPGTVSASGNCNGAGACCRPQGPSGQPPPTPNLTASPGTVAPGGTVTLNWNAQDATACRVLAGNFGPIGTSGPATEAIDTATTATSVSFRIACSNAYGETESTVATVQIQGEPVNQHLECRNSSCTIISEVGANDPGCNNPGDSCTAPTHLGCVNNACVTVPGQGGNQCTTSAQCAGTTSCPCGGGSWGESGVKICKLGGSIDTSQRCTILGPNQNADVTVAICNNSGGGIYSKEALFYTDQQTCGAHADNAGHASVEGDTDIADGDVGTVTYSFNTGDCGSWQLDDTWRGFVNVFVIGQVINTGVNCTTPQHLACRSNACTLVSGGGANEDGCTTAGQSCGGTPTSHTVCSNMACETVSGAGANECSADSECSKIVCQSNACVRVAGTGPDTDGCTLPGQSCGTTPTHTVCQNNACVSVTGAGTNQCAADAECVVTPQLSCTGTLSQADIGQSVPFSATGGTGTYTWYAPGGVPFTLPGQTFSTTYAAAGFKTVTVVSGGNQATCTVQISGPVVTTPPATTPPPSCTPAICATPRPGCHYENNSTCSCGQEVCPSDVPLACAPASQTVNVNQTADFQASGGSSQAYSWSAPNGNPRTGSSRNFSTAYSSTGTYTVTVTAGNQSATCSVVVRPPPTSPALSIQKLVRLYPNGTEQDSVTANPAQTVEFSIRVSSNGSGTATQVVVRDTLPSGLTYQAGTTTVDSSPAADGIVGSGLSLGDMAPGRTITVRFRALLAPAQFFGTGSSTMVNTAYAKAQNTAEYSDTAIVNVIREAPNASISLVKLGRNLTRNETGERSTVYADPAQTVEFIIRARNTSTVTLTNVRLRDVVPNGITFIAGTVKLNGQAASDAIVTSGLPVGSLTQNQEAVVTFSGRIASAANLPTGLTTLINTAYVTADNVPQLSAQLPVLIAQGTTPVTQVPTGPGESTILALIISAAITLLYVGYTGTDLYRRNEASALAGEKHERFDFRR